MHLTWFFALLDWRPAPKAKDMMDSETSKDRRIYIVENLQYAKVLVVIISHLPLSILPQPAFPHSPFPPLHPVYHGSDFQVQQ